MERAISMNRAESVPARNRFVIRVGNNPRRPKSVRPMIDDPNSAAMPIRRLRENDLAEVVPDGSCTAKPTNKTRRGTR
jgi:hypothetical protein